MEGTVLGFKTSNLNKKKKILSEGDAMAALVELKRKGGKLESGSDLEKDISRFVGKDVPNADIALGILRDKEDKRKTEYVDKEIEERSKILAKDKGVEAQKRIKSELESIVGLKEFRSSDEESIALARAISGSNEVDIETQVVAKEAKLSLDKWQEGEIEEVRGYRREKFKKEFEAKTKEKNPGINDEQLSLVRQKADLIADIYFSDGGIENQKDKALEVNKSESMGKLESAWSGVEGVVGFSRKTSVEIKEILSKNQTIDAGLEGVNLPYENFANARSFDTIANSLNDTNTFGMFASMQNGVGFLGRSLKTISNYTGGWWEKGASSIANHFASKIGNQAVSSFVQNSMGLILKNGLQAGTQAILKGAAVAGTKVAAGAVGAAAGVASGPIGWMVTAGLAIKKFFGKIADKLGINFISKMKEALAITGNKTLDFIIQGAMLIVGIPALIDGITFGIGGILFGVLGGLFGAGMIQQNELISMLVPQTKENVGNLVQHGEIVYTDDGRIRSCGIGMEVDFKRKDHKPWVTPSLLATGNYDEQLEEYIGDAVGTACGVVYAAHYLAYDFDYWIPYWLTGSWPKKGLNPIWGSHAVSDWNGHREGPSGLDCGHFRNWAWVNGGYSAGMRNEKPNIAFGDCNKIKAEIEPGDGLYMEAPPSVNGKKTYSHSAIVIAYDDNYIKFAHAGGGSGVTTGLLDICTGKGVDNGNHFDYLQKKRY